MRRDIMVDARRGRSREMRGAAADDDDDDRFV